MKFRLIVWCLIEGSFRLAVSAKARPLWYSNQIGVRPIPNFVFMFDNPVNHSIPSDKACWGAGSNCKSIGKARVYGCTDNALHLAWGSTGGVTLSSLSRLQFKSMDHGDFNPAGLNGLCACHAPGFNPGKEQLAQRVACMQCGPKLPAECMAGPGAHCQCASAWQPSTFSASLIFSSSRQCRSVLQPKSAALQQCQGRLTSQGSQLWLKLTQMASLAWFFKQTWDWAHNAQIMCLRESFAGW
eukprot:1161770-Pelagomonas_calceolata.AAC.3